jgi:hypothetical protein
MSASRPKDRLGADINWGDLVLYDGSVWKLDSWQQGLSGHNLKIKQKSFGQRKVTTRTVSAARVETLGLDTVSSLVWKEVGEKKKANTRFHRSKYKYKVGQRVRLLYGYESGVISQVFADCVQVEIWDSTGFCEEKWDLDEIELCSKKSRTPNDSDYHRAMDRAEKAFGPGMRMRGGSRGNGEEPREKDSISRQELLRDEVNRLRRERVMGDRPPKKQSKKAKEKKEPEEKQEQPKSKGKLPVRRREW